jgi:hypothetical protein
MQTHAVEMGDSKTAIAREQLCGHFVSPATTEHAIMEEMFPVRFVLRLYNEDQLPLRVSLETAVRRVGCWCEMAASLRGREPGSRGTSTVGSRYQAAQ